MRTKTLDIPVLAAEFTAALPELDRSQQRLTVALYRLLAEGRPVRPEDLATRSGLPVAVAASQLDRLAMVERDERGHVIANGGLTLKPTSHTFEVDGHTLYTWCALDTLFVPELIGRPARVRSTSPSTGEVISLTVDATGVHDIAPEDAVMTLHSVRGFDLKDVVGTYCCYVHFFASEEAARPWASRSEGTYVVSIADGFEYGRLNNHARLGEALEEGGI